MRAKVLIPLLVLLCGSARAGDLTIRVDSNDWAVFTFPDHDGSLQALVRAAAAKTGSRIRYITYPWRRCELMVERGEIDGLLAVPWTDIAKDRFAYPMSGAKADPARAAARIDLVLVRRADSDVTWDGKRLQGLSGRVAHVQGYAELGSALEALGLPASDDYKSDLLDVRALLAGRTNVIATYAESADQLMVMPDFAGKLARTGPPFARLAYYLAFAKPVYAARRREIGALWGRIAEMRSGPVDPGGGTALQSDGTNGEH